MGMRKQLLEVMSMFVIFTMVMVSQVYTDVNTYQIVHVNYVQFMYQFYLSKSILERYPQNIKF